MTVLNIEEAVKIRDHRETVCHVNFTVRAGEQVALLGHNGAGKTTLLRLILGLTPLDGGSISILGAAPGSIEAQRAIAFLPENVEFPRTLSARELLRHFARLKGEAGSKSDDLLERVGLAGDADRRLGTFSKGMRQRLALAQALIGEPRLSLLDEPTSGLDPIAQAEFYEIIRELANAGGAVLLSSHALTEMEAKADRIAILKDGKLVANDQLDALRRKAGLPVCIRVSAKAQNADHLADTLGGHRINGRSVELQCPVGDKMEVLASVNAVRHLVDDIDILPPRLDDIYRHYSQREDAIS